MDTKESVITIYEKILSGEQKQFSPYFFQPQHRKERLKILIRYLISDILKLTPNEALEMLTMDNLVEYQLVCVLKYIDKPVEYLDDDVKYLVYFAFPELVKPTDDELAIMVYKDLLSNKRKTFPKNYFLGGAAGEQRAVVCFRYLCEDILKLEKQDIFTTFSNSKSLKILSDYKLKIIMNILFVSTVDLIQTAYPDQFKESVSRK